MVCQPVTNTCSFSPRMSVLWTSFHLEVNQEHKPGCQSYLWAITKHYSINTRCKRSVLVQIGNDDVHPQVSRVTPRDLRFYKFGYSHHSSREESVMKQLHQTARIMVCSQGNTWWIVRIPEQLMEDKTARVFWYTNCCPIKIETHEIFGLYRVPDAWTDNHHSAELSLFIIKRQYLHF